MNFNDIGLKDLVLDFDSNDLQDITIVQGDTKTRGFKVLVSTNNGEIIKASSNYEMRLYGINSNYPDKSFFTKATIDGDFYKVYISTDMASKSGKLQLQLALFEGTNALIQSRIKEVDVYRSIANGGNIGKDLVVDFGKLKDLLDKAEKQHKKFDESLIRQESIESDLNKTHTEVRQFRDELKDVLTTENARVEAEKKRVSAEDVRATNESTRQSNEQQRQSNENARQQNESTRTSSETQRQADESARKSDEQKRISAESSRNSEETKRDNAEKIRIENENKRISAENTRAENDIQYSKNEEHRQLQESTRQTQEQSRVDAENLRQSQEDTRKQSEDTRSSQEKTRLTQEQSRVDAESKRATSETTREESEQTRDTNETERQNAEKIRQSSEQTRVTQEDSRVEAEKQRVEAEADRAGKFAGWDKSMQGVIPTATSTVAGIVRIDVDGESTAVSKKSYEELLKEIESNHNQLIDDFNTEIFKKADKTDVDGLKEKVDNFKVSTATPRVAGIVKIDKDNESVAISEKTFYELCSEFDKELKKKADADAFMAIQNTIIENIAGIEKANESLSNQEKSISDLNTNVNAKADKKHTHTTADITNLQTVLDKKLEATDISKLNTKVNANSKSISDISTTLDKKADKTDLDNKAAKKHTHAISDVDGLRNTLDNHERIFNSNIGSISNLSDKLQYKASADSVAELEKKVDGKADKTDLNKKVSSDAVKNIAIIEKGASTTNIAPNTLIFEKE